MDFNQILLFAGIGVLAVVLLFALLGFLVGLKRELKCTAVFIVLLVLAWLVLGDAATFLNWKFLGSVAKDLLEVEGESIVTLWDVIVAYAQDLIPNGEALLVEGKETYALFHSVVSTVLHFVGLLLGTIIVLVISPIIRIITGIIGMIIRAIKRGNAKRRAARAAKAGATEAEAEVEEEKADEQIIIPSSESSADEAVITKEANELPVKPVGKRRLWGALTGALKGAFIVMILCAPLSGLVSILNTVSPKTQALLSNVMNGEMENVSQSNDTVDAVFDFAEAYNESALGQFIEAPGFFFGDSFSEKMFDNMFKVETKNQSFYLTDEIKTVIETVNALNGKVEVGTWSTTEVTNALNELKDSKLIVEVMPAIIEVAYEVEDIQAILEEAGQEDAFLDLRYNNWKNDISLLLDFVAEVYALDFFPIEDFDPLKLDAEQLRTALDTLSDTEIVNEGLNIALAIVFTMDSIEEMIGTIDYEAVEIDWKQEFDSLVDIYVYAQEVLADVESLQINDEVIKGILTNPAKLDSAFAAVKDLTSLQIMEAFGTQVVFGYIENSLELEDQSLKAAVLSLEPKAQMSDIRAYVDTARIALNLIDFSNYPTVDINPLKLDAAVLREVVNALFSTDLTLEAINVMVDWALAKEEIVDATNGALAELDVTTIEWQNDLLALVDVYEYFLGLGFESTDEFNEGLGIAEDILTNDAKAEIVIDILSKLAETDLFNVLSLPVVQSYIDEYIANNFEHFNDLLDITEMTVEEWQEDFRTLIEIAMKAAEINLFDFIEEPVITNLDITSPVAIKNIKDVIKGIFALNILGDDQFKTDVLVASVNQFGWTTLSEDFDASAINWNNERDVLVELVNVYVDINGLAEFDVYNLEALDVTALLENDDFFMYVVDALEAIVESDLVLELLPGLLDHHVLPKLNGLLETDDETLFSDLLHNLSSEEIVREIIKLIDVVKAAIDMNLLDVAEEGVQVIDIANTDAIKTIISGILESKFLDGHEGRIIRVLLKAFDLLDIEKDSAEYEMLINLDYTGETEVLLDIVDTLAPVLKDPDFTLFNEDGTLNTSLDFWLENANARIVLDAVEKITGSYEDDSVTGSKLLEVLLPLVYDKYVEGASFIPEDIAPVLEILNVTEASGAMLMNDLSCLVYILDQCITLGVHSLLGEDGGVDVASHNSITAINNILEALHNMQLFEGHEADFMSWALNFAADKAGVEIETNPEDFENVNWKGQKDFYQEIVSDLGAFLRNNNLYTIGDINEFIKNETYKTKEFITQDNAGDVLVILDKLVDVQIFDAISPLIVKFAISKVNVEGLSLDYVLDFTNSQINDDLHALIDVLQIAVNDIDIVNLYHNDFNGDIALPKAEYVANIVSILFDLHLVNEENGVITNYAFEKALGGTAIEVNQSLVLKIKDFDLANIDWHTEKEVFVSLVYNAFDLLGVNNIETVANLRAFISEKWYTHPTFFRDETGHVLADAVRSLAGSQIIENVIGQVWDYAVEELNKVAPFDVEYMNFIETALIMEDFNVLADIIDLAVDFGGFEYIRTEDIAHMNLEYVAQIIEKLPELNIIENVSQALLYDLYQLANKYVKQVLPIEITNIQYCELADELNVIANAVREAQGILEATDLLSLSSVLTAVKEESYKARSFYNEEAYLAAINVAIQIVNLNYVEQIAEPVVEYGLEKLADKGIKFEFVDLAEYDAKLIVEDIKVVLEMAKSGYALGVVDYAFTKDIPVVDITPVADMLEEAKALNILELYSRDFVAYMLDAIKTKTGFDSEITYEDLEQFFDYKVELDNLKDVIVELQDVVEALNIISLSSALDKVDEVKTLVKRSVKDLVNELVSEELAYEALDVVSEVLDFQLVSLVAELGVDMFVSFADSKNIDISYLSGIIYRNSLIVADAKLLVEVARNVVEAGALEYYKKGIIYQVEFEPVHDIIDLLAQTQAVNFFYDELLSLAANCICNVTKASFDYDAKDFKVVDIEKEVEALHAIISAIDTFLYENHIFSTDDIMSFVKNQEFNNADFFTLANGYRIEDLIVAVASLQVAEIVLPDLLNEGIITLKQVDLSFLKDSFTGAELAEDIKTIAHLIPLAIKADFAKVAYGLNVKELELNIPVYQEMINTLKAVNVLNAKWAEIAELGTNTIYNKLKVSYSVTVEDFAGIDFAADMDYLISALASIDTFLGNVSAVTVQDALDLTKELKTEKVVNTKNAYVVLDAVEALTSMQTIQALYPTLASVGSDKLAGMPTDLSYLLEGVTKEELVEDIDSVLNALNKLVAFGVIDIAFYDGYIGTDDFSAINTALEEILLLNVLEGNHTQLILDALKALKVETVAYQLTANLEAIDWNEEVESLQAVIEAVRKALVYTEIDKVSKVSSFDVNSLLVIDENTNELLEIAAELLAAIGNDDLIVAVSLPLAKKFMPNNAKLTNLADVHNIYFHTEDLGEDLVSLSEVIAAVRDLDINAILNKGAALPYGNLDEIETIIKTTLGLNYLQNTKANPDRVTQLIAAIDEFVPLDLANIDGTNVDLASDADYIYAAYEYFYNIACHDQWPLQYVEDAKSFKLSNEFLKDYHLYQDVLNVLVNIMDTTIYSEIAPAVVVEVLPKFESKFADIYDVLDLGNYSVAMAKNDLIVLADIVDAINTVNIVNIIELEIYFTSAVNEAVVAVIEKLAEFEVLKGKGAELVNYFADTYVNNKIYGDVVITAGMINGNDVDFLSDKDNLIVIINEFFNIANEIDVDNHKELISYVKGLNSFEDTKANLGNQNIVDSLENILYAIADLTVLQGNGYRAAKAGVFKSLAGGALGNVLDFSNISQEQFVEDLYTIANLLNVANEFGMVDIINDELINYDQADLFEEFFAGLFGLNILNINQTAIVEYVETLKLPVSVLALVDADFVGDAQHIANFYKELVPFLTSNDNPLDRLSVYQALTEKDYVLEVTGAITYNYLYEFVGAYEELVQLSVLNLMLPAVADKVITSVPEKHKALVDALHIDELTAEQFAEDLAQTAVILRTLVDLGLEDFIKFGKVVLAGEAVSTLDGAETVMSKAEMATILVDALHAMNITTVDAVLYAFDELGVDTTDMNLADIDYDVEIEALKSVISSAINVFVELGYDDTDAIKDYVMNFNPNNIKSELKTIYADVDLVHFVNIFNAIDDSQFLVEVFKPLYNKYIYPSFKGDLQDLGNLDSYTKEELDEDLHAIAIIANELYMMNELPGTMGEKFTDVLVVNGTKSIIDALFNLNILDMKLQLIVEFVDTKLGKVDLSGLDLSNVDLSKDAELFKSVAYQMLLVAKNIYNEGPQLKHLGDTSLVIKAFDVLKAVFDTDLFTEVSNWAANEYLAPMFKELDCSRENIADLVNELEQTIDALICMGFFSNDEVDFTNRVNTDRLFLLVENVFGSNYTITTHVNKLKGEMHLIGKVDIDWSQLDNKVEIDALKEAVKLIKELLPNVKAAKDLVDPQVQADITAACEQLFVSDLAKQLVLPIASGLVKIYTSDVYMLSVLEGVDYVEFINVFLPDVFELVEKADAINALSGSVDYKNTDGVTELFRVLVFAESFKNHTGDIVKFLFALMDIDVKAKDFSEINWEDEFYSLEAALDTMHDEIQGYDSSDKETYMNPEFISALADALPEFDYSKFLPQVAREVITHFLSKSHGDRATKYTDRLFEESYNNDALMNDYRLLDNILDEVVATGFLDDNIDYGEKGVTALNNLLKLFFELEYRKGMEATLLNFVKVRVSMLDNYTFNYDAVTDWEAEKAPLLAAGDEVVELAKVCPVNEINHENLRKPEVQNAFVDVVEAMSKTEMGRQFVPQIYELEMEPNLGSPDYEGILDFSDPGFTPDLWSGEFRKLFDVYNKLEDYGYTSGDMELSVADARELMIDLFGPSKAEKDLGIYAVANNPEKWLTRLFKSDVVTLPTGAMYNRTASGDIAMFEDMNSTPVVCDWADEPYALIAVMDAMVAIDNNSVFDYTNVYSCTDAAKLNALLTATLNSGILRGTTFQVLQNTIDNNSLLETYILTAPEYTDLLGTSYNDYKDNYETNKAYFTSAYWNTEYTAGVTYATVWAQAIAAGNQYVASLV